MTSGIKRRDFLKVLGVTGAGAALTGCSTKNAERLLPYVTMPEDITPGVATWFTTVCDGCSAQCGIWAKTREGRAIKLEGNPHHPVSNGALCPKGQASLQHLYNVDRYSGPMIRESGNLRPASWDEAEKLLAQKLKGAGGKVLYLGKPHGPTQTRLVEEFLEAVGGGKRVEYEPVSEAPLREATRIAFGYDGLPRYDIEGSRLLISFGSDFLEGGMSPVEDGRAFSRMSSVDEHDSKGRFIYVGPRLSMTAFNADEWIPINPGAEAAVALGMASVIAGSNAAGPYASVLRAFDPATAAKAAGLSEDDIRALAHRFMSEQPSLAMGPGAGAHHRNATAANLAALILNSVAGNVGKTLHLDGGPTLAARPYADMEAAVRSMASGGVAVAMVHGVNPVYALPGASGFKDAFASVGFKVSFASAPDETSALADLVMPDRHFLESWGDSEAKPGIYAIRQPIMEPVPHFDAKQTADVLISVGTTLGADFGGAATFYEYLHAANRAMYKNPDFAHHWHEMLRNGLWKREVKAPAASTELRAPDKALVFDVPTLDGDGEFALLVHPSARFGAGEHTNIPWLLEMADQVSKITWHSWLEMHPDVAEAHGLKEGDFVTVTSPYGSLDVPLWPYPGIRKDAVALAMGMGHTEFGRWATGQGVNAVELLPAVAEEPSGAFVTVATKVSVTPTGRSRRLAKIQGADVQEDRPLAPAVTLAGLGHSTMPEEKNKIVKELQGTGGFVPVTVPNSPNSYPLPGAQHGPYEHPEKLARWGMAIDLDKCTGCGACEVACMAENNVPWVGEDQVLMGREMHWLRIERYYETIDATAAGAVDVRVLPMMCQHCSNAPCEPVCPVFATYSTPEGVNDQVYNRCVGTRYCSNNCPYKVRTFNWLRYTEPQRIPEPYNWQWNPDVTVRDNGVMEKCSFCIQRVRQAENRAVVENRGPYPRDGEVVMACQQSCPAEAIVWGNLRDPDTKVSHVVANERTYRVLNEDLNTQPGVNYLKKVTFHQLSSEEGA